MKKVILISCGGTGGHITPGIALGEEIGDRLSEYEVIYVFSGKKIEEKFLPGLQQNVLVVREIQIRGMRSFFSAFIRAADGLFRVMRLLFRRKVVLIIGFGSATSLVAICAGLLFCKTFIILEQNAVMGRANRLASLLAKRVYISLPLSRQKTGKKIRVTGNPLRKSIRQGVLLNKGEVRKKYGLKKEGLMLLIIGGSQGALALNRALLINLPILIKEISGLQFIHVSGTYLYDELLEAYTKAGVNFLLKSFADDMASLYAMTDLALARAGSGTLFELSCYGIPGILVPYPHARDDHQRINAEQVRAGGGAEILCEDDLKKTETFLRVVKEICLNDEKRKSMSEASKKSLPHEAAMTICEDIRSYL